MEKHKGKILALVFIAVIAILGNKFIYGGSNDENPQQVVDTALQEHKPIWILFRSQT